MIISTEDKMLLLKDLCARIPYDTFIKIGNNPNPFPISTRMRWILNYGDEGTIEEVFFNGNEICRPFLRPMSDMTSDEKMHFRALTQSVLSNPLLILSKSEDLVDWLNENHFDWRGLIEKDLAVVAPHNMYKTYNTAKLIKQSTTIDRVGKDLIDFFKVKHVDCHSAGESFYLTQPDGTIIMMFDKSDKTREEIASIISDYMKDKKIENGQVRVSPMTLVWTSVYIEPYIGTKDE